MSVKHQKIASVRMRKNGTRRSVFGLKIQIGAHTPAVQRNCVSGVHLQRFACDEKSGRDSGFPEIIRRIGTVFRQIRSIIGVPAVAVQYSIGDFHPRNNRIPGYLHSLGIQTQRSIPGRTRKQSVKDFQSLRHCFCYYAGLRGVPLWKS